MEKEIIKDETSSKVVPIILAALSVAYGASPIDIIPDFIPVVGWTDDLVVVGAGILNLAESFTKDSSRFMTYIIKMVKWFLIIAGGILVMLVALFGLGVYAMVR